MSQKGNENDMIGFKDFLENQEEKRAQRPKSRQNNSTHELLSFFEKENNRLDKLIQLYTQKISMINDYPQEASLIVELQSSIIDYKIKLIDEFKKPDSHVNKNLVDIFAHHFSSRKNLEG